LLSDLLSRSWILCAVVLRLIYFELGSGFAHRFHNTAFACPTMSKLAFALSFRNNKSLCDYSVAFTFRPPGLESRVACDSLTHTSETSQSNPTTDSRLSQWEGFWALGYDCGGALRCARIWSGIQFRWNGFTFRKMPPIL
jgi:hypothetical protein